MNDFTLMNPVQSSQVGPVSALAPASHTRPPFRKRKIAEDSIKHHERTADFNQRTNTNPPLIVHPKALIESNDLGAFVPLDSMEGPPTADAEPV
jgi:hypothetical protein